MRTITEEELKKILALHALWVEDNTTGARADLSDTDLSDMDLSKKNLIWAKFSNADLSRANLSDANLYQSTLRGANLKYANLCDANLKYANLCDANLSDAILCGANLSGANLSGANLTDVCLVNHVNVSRIFGKPIYQVIYPKGEFTSGLTLLAEGERANWRWFGDSWSGSEEELKAKAREKLSEVGSNCLIAMDFLISLSKNAHRFND